MQNKQNLPYIQWICAYASVCQWIQYILAMCMWVLLLNLMKSGENDLKSKRITAILIQQYVQFVDKYAEYATFGLNLMDLCIKVI